jgi:hypothetical protein
VADDRVAITVRLSPQVHEALRRASFTQRVPMGHIVAKATADAVLAYTVEPAE